MEDKFQIKMFIFLLHYVVTFCVAQCSAVGLHHEYARYLGIIEL